jgi:hypothetical protein
MPTNLSEHEKAILVSNIKSKNIGCTNYGNSIYNDLWYVSNIHKLCLTFTPRGGCTISFKLFLDLIGLLEDGLKYSDWIHEYRCDIFIHFINKYNINNLINEKYTFIKFIINPYIRAVSVYRIQTSHNLSFRDYLKQLTNDKIQYFNIPDIYHLQPQYIDGEENIITKYIKINNNDILSIKLADGNDYELDVNKYTSSHHGVKNVENTSFCGDILRTEVNKNLPKSYKYFYDDEIKKMVETFYKNDIEKYGFSFDEL